MYYRGMAEGQRLVGQKQKIIIFIAGVWCVVNEVVDFCRILVGNIRVRSKWA